jgi:tryptophan 2,3-dioxygenase
VFLTFYFFSPFPRPQVGQFDIIETMTPLAFMEFRDFLVPASGFQSFQFRMFENMLGLQPHKRILHHKQPYWRNLRPLHQAMAVAAENSVTLFDAVAAWLERTPFLGGGDGASFDFLAQYRGAVHEMYDRDADTLRANESDADILADELKRVEQNREDFNSIFDEDIHAELVQSGSRRLPLRALQAALMIEMYHDAGLFQMPHQLIRCLVDIDEMVVAFRSKHMMMVTRMIGTKLGTGASSGYGYLRATVERGRVFTDLANLATFVIPKENLPLLPADLASLLQSHWEAVSVSSSVSSESESSSEIGRGDKGGEPTASAARLRLPASPAKPTTGNKISSGSAPSASSASSAAPQKQASWQLLAAAAAGFALGGALFSRRQ